MNDEIFRLWTYLSAQPLTGLTLTLTCFVAAEWIHRRLGQAPLASPVLIAVVFLGALLIATGTPYPRYFEGAQFVHFLLGPATVALAVPLYRQLDAVRQAAGAIGVGITLGGLSAAGFAAGLAWCLGADSTILRTIAPKSVTTPVAMGIAERIDGLPSLTAVAVIMTGIVGAAAGSPLLDLLGVRDPRARGLAFGVAAHGIGTARAFREGQTTGAFSSLGLGLNALFTALVLPALAAAATFLRSPGVH